MTTKTQLDKYVAEYINSFRADVITEETFTNNYMSNVENRKTEIVYSRNTPNNFVSKCNALKRDTGNKLYPNILTRHIEINLDAAMYSLLFKDLQQLFKKGFEVVESDSKRLILKRPATLFENLESDISSLYKTYAESTTQDQKADYLSVDKVTEYVDQCEREAKEQAIIEKQKTMQSLLERVNAEQDLKQRVEQYLSDKSETALNDIRTDLDLNKDNVSDLQLSDILKSNGYEKKRNSKGNFWGR